MAQSSGTKGQHGRETHLTPAVPSGCPHAKIFLAGGLSLPCGRVLLSHQLTLAWPLPSRKVDTLPRRLNTPDHLPYGMADVREFYEDYWEHREEIDHMYEDWTPKRIRTALSLIEQHGCQEILDIGCGEGTLGQLLDDDLYIVGTDISTRAVEAASEYYDKTHVVDVEETELVEYFTQSFDCVVCLEILEHLFDPEHVLESVRTTLDDDGILITSFPNFVYYRYRLDMLFGRVPQDYTLYSSSEHTQNFTIESFLNLLDNAGFDDHELYPSYKGPKLVPRFLQKRNPALFANQIVVKSEIA